MDIHVHEEYHYITRTLAECIPPPRQVMISKWENLDYLFSYQYGNTDHSQNLMRSKLDQDPSSDFFSGRFMQPIVFVLSC